MRERADNNFDLLVGTRDDLEGGWLPQSFVLTGEEPETALYRTISQEIGLEFSGLNKELISEGYAYDLRQTDHAWVERKNYLFILRGKEAEGVAPEPGGKFSNLQWLPLNAVTINMLHATYSSLLREAVKALGKSDFIDQQGLSSLLQGIG